MQMWLTAKRQGLRSATYFWPGSDVAVNGVYVTCYVAFPLTFHIPFCKSLLIHTFLHSEQKIKTIWDNCITFGKTIIGQTK